MFAQDPPPAVNQILSRHDVIWQPTVTIYSDDIFLGHVWAGPFPLEHVRAPTPPSKNKFGQVPPCQLNSV